MEQPTFSSIAAKITEDKHENLSTTSLKFKEDVWNFFKDPLFKTKNCIEFGTHKGQTTYVLSHVFGKVYTINLAEGHFETARRINEERSNITYIPFNLYTGKRLILPDTFSMAFIDAGHEYEQVKSDVEQFVRLKRENVSFIIFDDYGLMFPVWRAVDELVNNQVLEYVKFIGHPAGHDFGQGRVLRSGPEGVICRLLI